MSKARIRKVRRKREVEEKGTGSTRVCVCARMCTCVEGGKNKVP